MRKTSAVFGLLKALTLPGLASALLYNRIKSERRANDPWYREEQNIEDLYSKEREKGKGIPAGKPSYNVTDMEEQLGRSLV